MEQVVGDFFLELNLLTSNYGYFISVSYIIGVAASIYEKVTHERALNNLASIVKENVTKSNVTEQAIMELEKQAGRLEAESPAPVGSELAVDRSRKMLNIVRDCDQLYGRLAEFDQAKDKALKASAMEEVAHPRRKKVIAGSVIIGLVVTGGVWVFKALTKVFSDPTKA